MGRLDLTAGERSLLQAYLAVGGMSAVLALTVVAHLDRGAVLLQAPSAYAGWLLVSGAVAGVAALRAVRHRIGLPGAVGAFSTAGAALVATLIAGVVGGSLALPVYGTMFGPFSLLVTLAAMPGLGIAWLGCFVLAHLWIRLWHVERDSIFHCRPLGCVQSPSRKLRLTLI